MLVLQQKQKGAGYIDRRMLVKNPFIEYADIFQYMFRTWDRYLLTQATFISELVYQNK